MVLINGIKHIFRERYLTKGEHDGDKAAEHLLE